MFLPNEAELCAIAGSADVEVALGRLAGRVPLIGVKLGARGGVARQGHTIVRAPALPVPVADTTGAGDLFDAGFVYGFVQGWGLEGTLRLACACGSLSTRAAGGTAAQPTLAEDARRYDPRVTPNPAIDRTLELPQIVLGAVLRAKHSAYCSRRQGPERGPRGAHARPACDLRRLPGRR